MLEKIKQIHDRLRQKTTFHLIDNDAEFYNLPNPFCEKKVPILCDFLKDYNFPFATAYESGNRSLLFQKDSTLIKAKGVGIPVGFTRPFFEEGEIFTYKLLDDPGMCHKSILWGFMEKEEFTSECYGAKKAEELGQRIKLSGFTSFQNLYAMTLKDRPELFKMTKDVDKWKRLDNIRDKCKKETGYSVFYEIPSDIRVQEILFTYIFPQITELIDKKEIREFTRWLGESCSVLLNEFHRLGNIHGTWLGDRTAYGFFDIHSNSYVGNYVVDERGITMCDFDLAKPSIDQKLLELEKWSLIHMENPLYYAGSVNPSDAIRQGIAKKNQFREELCKIFEQAVENGYRKRQISVDEGWITKMLEDFSRSKSVLWKLYDLPLDIGTKIDYIDHIISTKKIDRQKFKEIQNSI